MKKKLPAAVLLAAVIFLCAVLCSCSGKNEVTLSAFIMDTAASVKVAGGNAEETAQKIINSASGLEKKNLSRTENGSDVFKVNSSGAAQVSEKTAAVIKKALDVCEKSGGALDIGLGAVSDLWGVKTRTSPPADSEIKALLADENRVELSGNEISLSGGALLDLGSVGKGAACDEAFAVLKESGATRAAVSFGGSILFYGEGEFTVGIASPQKGSSDYIAKVTTGQGFISTSGTYERYFDYNGVRYHHILDPKTGFPVNNSLVSVTAFAADGVLSDALSTACFVLGVEEGLKLAESYGADVLFVDENGAITVSHGLKDKVEITNDEFYFN